MSELLYMKVADSVMERIHNGVLKEQEKLSERKLAKEYEVSRTVVREAIKLLNEKGLVHTVYGKGSYVSVPDDQLVINKFQNAMDMTDVDQEDVLEARSLVEYAMVPYIIERTTPKDIEVLTQIQKKLEESILDDKAYIEYDEKFHLALSMCTHNRVITIITGSLNSMANREAFLQTDYRVREQATLEHAAILTAIKKKDETMLLHAIETHIRCVRSHVGGDY